MILRFKSVKELIEDYLAGKVERIEELEQQRLAYITGQENKSVSVKDWAYAATSSFKYNYFN